MVFEKPLIVFDGVCVLCSRLLRFVLWADRKRKVFQFATTQSEIGQKILSQNGYDTENFETVLFITPEGNIHSKMDCVIEVSKSLGGFWHFWRILKILPKSWRNGLYDFVATRRYKWFGKSEYCQRIPPKYLERIIQ